MPTKPEAIGWETVYGRFAAGRLVDSAAVDRHSFDVLELPAIRARLAGETAFAGGRALAEALEPSPDPGEVGRRQAETAEAVHLLEVAPPRLGGAADVRPAAQASGRGVRLQPEMLAAVAQTIRVALDVRRGLLDAQGSAPLLADRASVVAESLDGVASQIEGAVEEDGSDLRDDASPKLRGLRREIARTRERAAERLRSLAQSGELRASLQEDFVTERAGRPVLAVKASARSSVPGIVHDSSGSGQTLFIEPFALVELHNRLRELAGDEREEVERILDELSTLVGGHAEQLSTAVDALAAIDLALACASLSRRWRGCPVEPSADVHLEGARHPLLDAATAVPIDLALEGLRGVVLTGANTGGKTVALKTLGLSALLHQCGLRPPATIARLPVFDEVLADIGDEQSIEQSLSTFSGHLRNLRAILETATPRSLVLLDEVAAGTDPVEGAALAQAFLGRLVSQGTLVLATTHYAELKQWAGETDGVTNAAVGFDPETLAPTYRVTLGRPGASHALSIAERLGLDPEVVRQARGALSSERVQTERLLAEAARAEQEALQAREEAERLQEAAEEAHAQAERREAELAEATEAVRAGAEAARLEARQEAERDLAGAQRELEALRAEIREARREEQSRRRATSDAADRAERERDRRLDAASRRSRSAGSALQGAIGDTVRQVAPLAVGDPVMSPSLGVRGTIVELSGDTAEVQGRGVRIRVAVDRLVPDPHGRTAAPAEPPVQVRATAPAGVASEIDVRGRRADEAREAARSFVDAAHLAGRQEVRIVHGRGTGAVRAAVRDEIGRHPLVEGFESDSADGATVVKLAAGRPR
jgi:DNA mismatch repair protein MutS2